MKAYIAFPLLDINGLQLLLIKTEDSCEISIFNEHTNNTILRLVPATLANLERAISILKGESSGDY